MTPGLQDGVRRPPGGPAVSSCSDAMLSGGQEGGSPTFELLWHSCFSGGLSNAAVKCRVRVCKCSGKSEETRAENMKFEQNRAELHSD